MSQVLIIGGGLSGLCLAQGLKKQGIPFTIFERDQSTQSRAQGYRLRLVEGAEAIDYACSDELFTLVEKTCVPFGFGKGVRKNPVNGEALPSPFGSGRGPAGVPEAPGGPKGYRSQNEFSGRVKHPFTVDRRLLRDVLMKDIEEHVQFDAHFTHYTIESDGVTAHFKDGKSIKGRLLVGADGRMSKVKNQLAPGNKFLDTEARCFYGKTPMTPEVREALDRQGIHGMSLLTDTTIKPYQFTMLLEPMVWSQEARNEVGDKADIPDDYVYWVCASRIQSFPLSAETLVHTNNEDASKLSTYMFQHWQKDFHAIFKHQDTKQTSLLAFLSGRPDMPAWQSSPYVTIIGDAVHPMPPTAGAGANTALKDSERLLRKIAQVGGVTNLTEEAIRETEDAMRAAAAIAIQESIQGGVNGFGLKSLKEIMEDAEAKAS
jgi:2-polyprenyl-6-methoxyphenol hydroxylase-like FAD-dependent oxidoreductase